MGGGARQLKVIFSGGARATELPLPSRPENLKFLESPADLPLCFPKENVQIPDFPPPADFPLCFPKEMSKFRYFPASGSFSFVFP